MRRALLVIALVGCGSRSSALPTSRVPARPESRPHRVVAERCETAPFELRPGLWRELGPPTLTGDPSRLSGDTQLVWLDPICRVRVAVTNQMEVREPYWTVDELVAQFDVDGVGFEEMSPGELPALDISRVGTAPQLWITGSGDSARLQLGVALIDVARVDELEAAMIARLGPGEAYQGGLRRQWRGRHRIIFDRMSGQGYPTQVVVTTEPWYRDGPPSPWPGVLPWASVGVETDPTALAGHPDFVSVRAVTLAGNRVSIDASWRNETPLVVVYQTGPLEFEVAELDGGLHHQHVFNLQWLIEELRTPDGWVAPFTLTVNGLALRWQP